MTSPTLASTVTITMRTSTFDLRGQAAGIDLEAKIRDWRAETPPASCEEIVYRLRALKRPVVVSAATVARWLIDLGLPSISPKAIADRKNAEGAEQQANGAGQSSQAPMGTGEKTSPFSPDASSVLAPKPPQESAYERELRISWENS